MFPYNKLDVRTKQYRIKVTVLAWQQRYHDNSVTRVTPEMQYTGNNLIGKQTSIKLILILEFCTYH